MIRLVPLFRIAAFICSLIPLSTQGCLHRIHVAPTPPMVAERSIGASVQITVTFLALEGADHMPGIGSLDWPAKDLQSATIDYVQHRGTFASAGTTPGHFALTIRAWLTMKSRGNYLYKLRLESDLGASGNAPIKTYVVEKETIGSVVRWVTATDRDPIQQAVQAALDDLFQQIERDAALYRR